MKRPMLRLSVPVILILSLAACQTPEPSTTLRVSGHVEATEIQVSSEVRGRILEMLVSEGDRVNRGALVARLDTRDAELQIGRARAERATAEAQLRLLRAGSRPEDIRQAEAQVDAAEAEVAATASEVTTAEADLERFESLLRANAGSVKQRDDARARVEVGRERRRGAAERVRAAREVVARLRAGARQEEVEVALTRIASVDAQIALLQKAVGDATVLAPADGVVTQRLMEPGEFVAPPAPIALITDLDHAWAELFVPEPLVPRVTIGQRATVFTDAGGAGLEGKVTYVSPNAEFTPRNVQTADERSKLVYRIKVSVDNRDGVLKPGMPVDAELGLR